MANPVIRVENLGKKYVIGRKKQKRYKTLRDSLTSGTQNLWRSLRRHKSRSESSAHEEFWALKDVSFEVNQGDRIGIIGRNGAGKSTLLKVLSRITQPTEGRIRMNGRVASLLEVGTGFHPELTGRENIYLNGAILGMGKQEISKKFDEIIAFAEIERFLDTPVKRYSSGMYVRLAFAVAAHLEPEILIVDEVLAVGDASFQKKCLGKMEDVATNEGRTVLFVSHNMAAITKLCSKALFLEQGGVKKIGTPDDVMRDYLKLSSNSSSVWHSEDVCNDQPVYLKSVLVKDSNNSLRSDFVNHEAVYVEISVYIAEYISQLKIGFDLESEWGTQIFTSFHNDIYECLDETHFKAGVYTFTAIIPDKILNASTYYISPIAGKHRVQWFFREERAVSFNVGFQMENSDYFLEKRAGCIAPFLNWSVNSNS